MFNLFRKKPETSAPVRSAPTAPLRALPATYPERGFDPFFVIDVAHHLLSGLVKTGVFQGGLAKAPGFMSQMMPQGPEVAAHPQRRAGAVMAERNVGVSFAGGTSAQIAVVAIDTFFARDLSGAPKWVFDKLSPNAKITGIAELGPKAFFDIHVEEGPVEPLFDGQKFAGATMILTGRARN